MSNLAVVPDSPHPVPDREVVGRIDFTDYILQVRPFQFPWQGTPPKRGDRIRAEVEFEVLRWDPDDLKDRTLTLKLSAGGRAATLVIPVEHALDVAPTILKHTQSNQMPLWD